jgi:hypothetical protein
MLLPIGHLNPKEQLRQKLLPLGLGDKLPRIAAPYIA